MSPSTSSWSFSQSAPGNNSFSSSQFLDICPRGWWSSHNVGASRQGSEPISTGERTVWFTFFLEHAGDVTFTIDRTWGDLENAVLSIYTGGSIGSLTLIGTDRGPNPSVTFTNNSNFFYRISIGGVTTSDQGGFVFSWDLPQAQSNYTFAAATVLGTSGTVVNQNANGTMAEFGDIIMDTASDAPTSLWYQLTAPFDGFLEITATPAASEYVNLTLYRGSNHSDLQLVLQETNSLATVTVGCPVSSGDVYYLQASPYVNQTVPLFSFTYAFTAVVAANFYDPGEIQSNSPGSYTTFEINPGASNPRSGDWHYVGFYVRYGDANRPPTTGPSASFPQIARLRDSAGTEICNISIYGWDEGIKFQGQFLPRQGTTPQSVGSSRTLDAAPRHIEILLQCKDTTGYSDGSDLAHFFVDGSFIGNMSTGISSRNGFRYLDIGQVYNPDSWTLDLRYTHIRAVNLRDYDIPPPDLSPGVKRIIRALGFENNTSVSEWKSNYWSKSTGNPANSLREGNCVSQETWPSTYHGTETATYFWGDSPGRGRGLRMIGSVTNSSYPLVDSGSAGGNLKFPMVPETTPMNDVSWWLYVDSYPTSRVVVLEGNSQFESGSPSLQYDVRSVYMLPDGTLAMGCGTSFQWSAGTYVWSSRKVELNTWAHIEVAFNLCAEQPTIRWWLNGEEQAPFVGYRNQDLTNNLASYQINMFPTWGETIQGVNPGGSCWITDVAVGLFDGSPIGPIKSQLHLPDASGTHVVGTAPTFFKPGLYPATEQEPYSMFTTVDNGVTNIQLNPTDPVHTFIDDWPPVIGADFVGMTSWGPGVYIEYSYQDVDSGAEVLFVNSLMAARGFHHNYYGFPPNPFGGYYTDFQPTVSDKMPDNFWWLHDPSTGEDLQAGTMGANFINQGGETRWYKETSWPRGFSSQQWTPSMINSAFARWGEREGMAGNPTAPSSPGVCLIAQAIEVITADSYPALTAVGASPSPPDLEEAYWANPESELDSCMGDDKNNLATDPYMKNAVWRMPFIGREDAPEDRRRDVEWYWRVTPAQNDQPGFDGSFHDTDADRLAGTTSFDVLMGPYFPIMWDPIGFGGQYLFPLGAVFNYPTEIEGSRWGHAYEGYFDTADTRIRGKEWIFNPCRNTIGKIGTDRTVVIEFYARDSWGKTSSTTSVTYTINKGICCDFIPQIYRIIKARG